MHILLIAAVLLAALEILALQRNRLNLEALVKPGGMIALFFWLWAETGLGGAAGWFALGIGLSLAGDALLTLSRDRWFPAGLVLFSFARLAYGIGLNIPPPQPSIWGIALSVIVGVGGARVIRRILAGAIGKGQVHLRMPILVYGVAISLTLLSAMLKLTEVRWEAGAALLVGGGAFLLYLADILLVWTQSVAPISRRRISHAAASRFGQIALVAGVIAQYTT